MRAFLTLCLLWVAAAIPAGAQTWEPGQGFDPVSAPLRSAYFGPKMIVPGDMGSGTPDDTTFLRGDGTWEVPVAAGDGVLSAASWSTATQTLTLTLVDGTAIPVALSGLETQAEVTAAIDAAIANRLARSDLVQGNNITLTPGTGNHVTIAATPGADGVVSSGVCSGNDLRVSRTEGLPNITFTDVCIGAGAGAGEQNVQADWDEADTGSDAYIQNKDAAVAAINSVAGLTSKTADLSVDVIGRTWSNVGAVADGGFYWRSAIPTLAQAAALDSSYVVSVTPTASQALNFYTLLRIPDGHDSRDFRVRQVGDLGTFDTTGWHLIGSQGGFDYHYAQRNLFEGYTVTVQESVTETTTHFRGESDAENVTVDASGFSGNLSGTDTDVATALGTLDALSVGGAGASVTNDTILFGAPENESETVAPSRHAVAIMGEVLDFRTPDSTGTTGHVWTKTATEGEWAAVDAVDIAAYSSSATYERGSRNSIVTHANHVWVYVSTQRNTNHDPEQFPQYWWKIDTPIRVLNHDSATTTHWRSGEFFLTETGELRMATATISASPADIIADHTGADQEFLWLNEAGSGSGTTVTANPSGTDGDDLIRITIGTDNFNIAGRISWGFVIDTLIVPELNQDAITDARIILEDSGLTHYLTFLDWTAANLNSISHLPVGAHIGLRQGVTTRILEVEAEWDATNARYRVININTGILSESASGTATELLLTAGAGGAGGGTGEALQIEDVGGPFDIDIAAQDRFYDSTIDMPATADIEDDDIFEVSFQFTATGNPKLEPMRFFGKDWKALVALTSTQQSQTGFTAGSAAKTITGWLRYTTSTGGQTQRNTYVAKGEDGTSLYIGDNNNGYEATVQVWKVTTASGAGGGGGSDLAVQEEGTEVASAATVLNFTGTGATATASNGTVTVDISGASGITQTTGDARYLNEASNLSDLDSAATARTNLGLGDAAEEDVGLGSGNVPQLDSNGDLNVSVIPNTIARLESPALTGNPTAPTQAAGNDSTRLATTAFVQDEVDGYTIPDGSVTSAKLAANAAGEGKVPIDNTMQFDGSGNLGVNTERVVQEVSEWVQHFASGDSHDTSGHSGKYQEYTSPNTVRRIGSVQYDFDPLNDSGGGGTGKTYQVFVLELSGRNVDAVLGSSAVYSGNSLQHRFHFTDGVLINPNVRIGIGLHRTDGGNNEGLSVRFGTESQNSPRESYDDASEDFNFLGRFNHDRPTPSVNDTVGGTTANQIYGNPEIFYQIIHTHESLVGDGTVSSSHISSGSAADGTVLTADGSGGVAFEDVADIADGAVTTAKIANNAVTTAKIANDAVTTEKISGFGVTHIESGGTYNNNVISIQTVETVRSGDGILFAVPTPFGTSSTQTISLAIDGQANSTFPLHDRNGDELHEDDLTGDSVYVAILEGSSWDILVLPDEVGSGGGSDLQVADEGSSLTTAATAINFAGAGVTATASAGAVTVTIPGGGGGSGSGNPNATRIVTGATYDAGAGGNESIEAPGWRSCDMLFPVFHDSSESAAANANSNRPDHGVDMFFASALDTDGSLYVGVSQNEGVRILRAAANDFLTFQWVGSSPAPGSSDTLDIWCLDAGGSPGGEAEDTSVSAIQGSFDETTINVPSSTWGYVNFGDIGIHRLGEWHRFLVADLTGLTDGIDNGAMSDANSLTFLVDEETYFRIGKTSGDKVLVGTSSGTVMPGTVRIRSN